MYCSNNYYYYFFAEKAYRLLQDFLSKNETYRGMSLLPDIGKTHGIYLWCVFTDNHIRITLTKVLLCELLKSDIIRCATNNSKIHEYNIITSSMY